MACVSTGEGEAEGSLLGRWLPRRRQLEPAPALAVGTHAMPDGGKSGLPRRNCPKGCNNLVWKEPKTMAMP